jgi:hypothetical protein
LIKELRLTCYLFFILISYEVIVHIDIGVNLPHFFRLDNLFGLEVHSHEHPFDHVDVKRLRDKVMHSCIETVYFEIVSKGRCTYDL